MKILISTLMALWLLSGALLHASEDAADSRRLVTIDILIAELGKDMEQPKDLTAKALLDREKEGKLAHATRVRLVTVENQSALVQLGEQVPMVTSRSAVGRGFAGGQDGATPGRGDRTAGPRFAATYSFQNVGTLVSATPRVESTGSIIIDLKIEKSRLADVDVPADEEDASESRRQKIVSLRGESTIRIRGGEPVLAEGFQSGTPSDSRGQYIVISASAEPRPAAAEAAVQTKQEATELRIFALRNADANEAVKLLTTVYGSPALRVAADARTNTVIVYGGSTEQSGLEELLKRLDEQRASGQ
jgi:type II secretory pathway component GspD/PulD (secretin)